MDLENFSTPRRFFCKLLRIEADTKIVLDQSQALVGGCNFKIRTEQEAREKKSIEYEDLWCWCYFPSETKGSRKFFQ